MAITHHFCDPSLNSDNTGTGIGDPWGDVEYLLENATPGSNGNQINVKSGVAEVLAAGLETAFATGSFTATTSNPLIIKGYNSVADDGGIGEISGGGSIALWTNVAQNYIRFADMRLGNTGANKIFNLNDYCHLIRCDLHSSSAATPLDFDNYLIMTDSYLHDLTNSTMAFAIFAPYIARCYFEASASGSNSSGISCSYPSVFEDNVFDWSRPLTPGAGSIITITNGGVARNNSIYTKAGHTGNGIRVVTNGGGCILEGNLIEGFNGVGGRGAWVDASGSWLTAFRGNAFYNCTTAYGSSESIFEEDNEILTESPFVDAANGDFTPKRVGNVWEGALPQVIGGGFV